MKNKYGPQVKEYLCIKQGKKGKKYTKWNFEKGSVVMSYNLSKYCTK
jgi:hypothetical protein